METKSLTFMHVFLGRGHSSSQKIVLCAPYNPELTEVECTLMLEGIELPKQKTHFHDPEMRNFIFEFHELVSGGRYSYKFSTNGKPLALGYGLESSDLNFTYWKTLDDQSETVLMSCNGVYIFKDKTKKWAMWQRLWSTIQLSKKPPKLLILGGDQYYQDDTEAEYYNKLGGILSAELRNEVKMKAIQRVWEQTCDLSYRRLMASIPSVAMLDDHDITDGAGGRFQDEKGIFPDKWNNYASVLIEIFEAFQASRNPEPIHETPGAAYSFFIDLGETALVALDMRTEKNSVTKTLMSKAHAEKVFQKIESLPHKNVMILLPVVPIRSSRELEGFMTLLAKVCNLKWTQKMAQKIHPKFGDLVEYIGGMEDDLEDALTSECGLPFFEDLIVTMSKNAKTGTKYTFLSGDIHTGGSVEMHTKVGDFTFAVPILVSSPIGYNPMPKIVEGLLQESTMVDIQGEKCRIVGVPNQFFTHRNFLFLNPALLNSDEENSAAKIYVEDVRGFRYVPLSLWHPNETEEQLELTAAPVYQRTDETVITKQEVGI